MYKSNRQLKEESLELLRDNWLNALIVCFIVWFLANSADVLQSRTVEEIYRNGQVIHKTVEQKSSLLGMVNFFLAGPALYGLASFFMKLKREGQAEVTDIFLGLNKFGRNFLTSLLITIFVALWTLLLIIPGIIASYSYSMTWFVLNDNPHFTARQAISRSKELMRGRKMDLFSLQVSFIAWGLLAYLGAIFTMGLSVMPLNAYYTGAKLAFYEELIAREGIYIDQI